MKKNHTLILILTILLAFIITNGLFSLSSIKDFGKETFSTKRVIEDLKVIAKEPHSVAHPEEKDKVLNYLKAQLESLGGETQIYVYPTSRHVSLPSMPRMFWPHSHHPRHRKIQPI